MTLIMSPWNYPLLLTLTLAPLADALAAGNTAVVKAQRLLRPHVSHA